MSVDTSGRRAARALLQATERLGPPPDLDRLRRRHRRRATGRAGLAFAAVIVAGALVGQGLPELDRLAPDPRLPAAAPATTRAWPGVPGLDRRVRDAVGIGDADASTLVAATSAVWVINHHNDRRAELVRVDPGSDQVVARIQLGDSSSDPAVGEDGSLFAVRPRDGRYDRPELVRVDPATNRIAATIALPSASPTYGVSAIVAAGGAVWVAYPERGLVRVDPASRQAREVQVDGRPLAVDHLAFAGGWLWAAHGLQLHRVDPADGTVKATVTDPDLRGVLRADALAGDAGALWLHGFGAAGELLFRIDPVSGQMQDAITLSHVTDGRAAKAGADGRVVAVRSGSSLFLVDPAAGVARATVPLPGGNLGMAVGGGAVWVGDPTGGRLLRVDPGP